MARNHLVMRGMAMKTVAALAATAEDALRPARFLPRLLVARRKPVTAPVGEPPAPPSNDPSSLEPTIYRFILRHSLPQQLFLLLITLISFPFLYYSLDLPKTIVNHAINGKQFPQYIFGMSFSQIPYLFTLCGIFLALVFITGMFKLRINTLK